MDYRDIGPDEEAQFASEPSVQDARDAEVREVGEEKLRAFQEELSGTTTRPERFGVGPKSRNALFESARNLRAAETFHVLASAAAYQQPVTLSFGGRSVSMQLSDLRTIASQLRNKATDQARSLAYDGLLALIDDVANGRADPSDIDDYINEHGLGEDIAQAAEQDPAIVLNETAAREHEAQTAGTHADKSASEQSQDFLADVFGA